MPEPLLWTCGDWRQAEFAAAFAFLNDHARCQQVDAADEAPAAGNPAAIVIAQSRPGQFSRRQVERLHAAAPLARLISFVGPWCEGEMRSGRPWPGVVRIPWRTWRSRLPRELGMGATGIGARLPRTATEVERLGSSLAALRHRQSRNLTAEIATACRGEFESLREALAALGLRANWRRPGQSAEKSGAAVILSDGWENVDEFSPGGLPRILLLHFPRPDDVARATGLGIGNVLARPLLLADLAAMLDEVVPVVADARESAA